MSTARVILMGFFLVAVMIASTSAAMPIPGAIKNSQKEMTEKKKLKEDIRKVIPKVKKK